MHRRRRHIDAFRRLVGRALANGAVQASATTIKWDCSGSCTAAREFTYSARPTGKLTYRQMRALINPRFKVPSYGGETKRIIVKRGSELPLYLDVSTRCRECERCLGARRALWRNRAAIEITRSVRSWFGTLTINPEHRHILLSKARKRSSKQGADFEALPERERFASLVTEANREVTLWLKRLRKTSGASVRLLVVAEAHASGDPHFHCLIHQVDNRQVMHKHLSGTWRLGFTRWKLIDGPAHAAYITKYLAKDSKARVRASLSYGRYKNPLDADSKPIGDACKNIRPPNPEVAERHEGPSAE